MFCANTPKWSGINRGINTKVVLDLNVMLKILIFANIVLN